MTLVKNAFQSDKQPPTPECESYETDKHSDNSCLIERGIIQDKTNSQKSLGNQQ